MSIFKYIKEKIVNPVKADISPIGYCPNCWGRQEYEGKFFEAIHKEQIDLNNVDQKKGWIEAYAIRNLEGIKLKEKNDKYVCPSCTVSYKIA